MYWQAIVADRWIELSDVQAAFADAFGLPRECVDVVDDVAELVGPVPPEPRILVERGRGDGAFPMQIDAFLGGDAVEGQVADLAGTLSRMRALARHLNATLVFGEGGIGHDEQLRARPDGTIDVVALDGDAFDEDRIVVVGARPFREPATDSAPARAS
jgi:hypothetical protein